jgi:hypothetical protein
LAGSLNIKQREYAGRGGTETQSEEKRSFTKDLSHDE